MSKILRFSPRPKSAHSCAGCGERLAPWQPADHRLCRRCYGFASFRRAITEMLDATRPGR